MNKYSLILASTHLDLFIKMTHLISCGAGYGEGYSDVKYNTDEDVVKELKRLESGNTNNSFIDDVVIDVFELLIEKELIIL